MEAEAEAVEAAPKSTASTSLLKIQNQMSIKILYHLKKKIKLLVACTRLYSPRCPSICLSLRPLVCLLVLHTCPRSLLLASPVVRVIQNEYWRSEKIVFNVKDEFCKQTKTNESLPKQTKANKTNLWNKRGHEYYIPEKTSTMSSAHTVIAELLI